MIGAVVKAPVQRAALSPLGFAPAGDVPPDPGGDGFAVLEALADAGKVISAWIIPQDEPTRYLTLDGANATGWTAAYGTLPVNMVEVTKPPQFDASLYGGRGGLTFDGAGQSYRGASAPTGWPRSTGGGAGFAFIGAGNQASADVGTTRRSILQYGSTESGTSWFGFDCLTVSGARRASLVTPESQAVISGGYSGSHTLMARRTFSPHKGEIWYDGTKLTDATGGTASNPTLSRVAIGRNCGSTITLSSGTWQGDLVGVAVLNDQATTQDLLDLEAEFRARIT